MRKLKGEEGQAVIEFALVLPILMLLLCGIIEFGWVFSAQLAANNCAREGARFAVTNCYKNYFETSTSDKVLAVAPDSIKDNITTTVTCSNSGSPRSGDITVTVRSYVNTLTFLGNTLWSGGRAKVSATVTMKGE